MLLTVENLTHVYMPGTPFEVTALKNINMQIEQGEFLAIIGQTGSGKSTLVQHFNGLLKATCGHVILSGSEIGRDKAALVSVRRRVGLLFQFPEQQLFEETVFADVAFGPRNLGLPQAEVKRRVNKALALVGLDAVEISERSPFSLSGGQMRRVAMAGVLAMEPEIIILDEPTAGLDPRGRKEILGQIAGLHREQGLTVVLVSHSMEDVARLADRLLVMAGGEICLRGTPAEVFKNQAELETLGLGLPQMTQLMHRLNVAGKRVPLDVFTVERAKEVILDMLGGSVK
ncbi:MAG: energy-coupling factor transporter ATPase [Dethiobacter sp.]|jgi:energy-coupling factor transport system ATP-binding protein|nr:energy-coupling factor transporter ATPase [Dethiobacter sp.]